MTRLPALSPELWAGLAVAAALAAWILTRPGAAQAAGAAVATAAVDAAGGAVIGVGDAVGLPRTEADACARALAEGRTWDASFACPAGTWLRSWLPSYTAPSQGGATGSW